MKKNIGSVLALYPMPLTVVGAADSKPTWTLVAHVGIIGHDRILVSLASAHYINSVIKRTLKLSVNLVNAAILDKASHCGFVSGGRKSKANVFDCEMVEDGVPMILDSPLTLACSVCDVYETPGFESFICTIDATYVDEKHLDEKGKIDYNTLKPILFEYPNYEYLETGRVVGKCLEFKGKE